MTAIGPGISTQDPVVGWEAIQPKHKPMCELVVRLAEDRLAEAWDKLDVLHGQRDQMSADEFLLHQDNLAAEIDHAKREQEAALEARAAYYQKQRKPEPEAECTCTPMSDACPVCAAHQRQVYGDTIPVEGA